MDSSQANIIAAGIIVSMFGFMFLLDYFNGK